MTAAPTSVKKNIDVAFYDPRNIDAEGFITENKGKSVLVVGHSNTTPMLVHLLGGKANSIDESEYGDLYKLKITQSNIATEIVSVPPIEQPITQALEIKPIKSKKAKFRMV